MRRKIICSLIAILVFIVASLLLIRSAFYGNCVEQELTLYVYNTTQYQDLRSEILSNIAHHTAFDIYAKRLNLSERLKPGHYCINKGMSVVEIVRMLKLGKQTPINLVLSNARTLPQLAGKIAAQIEADSLSVIEAMYDRESRRSLGYDKDSLMAMFIPNTYEVYWTITPQNLLLRLKRENDAFWQTNNELLHSCGMSSYEVMTLASIVYEETKSREEMPKIAGVYVNRLRKGVPLQACPTVKFAMGDFNLRRVLYKHLRYKSPYNTYINRGLPPGPICMPSITAIKGVLDYERSEYMFFCARPEFDGRHNFAKTYSEHMANSKRYSEALERLKIK